MTSGTTWDISTPLSLSADYFLTEYTDADKIWRYDSASDCLMSMRYGYSDAIAIDSLYALSMLAEQSDLELCPEPIGRTPWWPTSPTPAGTFWNR